MKYLLLFFFIPVIGFSQTLYKGNVSESGMPIPGATICVKGTTRCTQSDMDGNYAIYVKIGDEIQISFLGMKTTTIKITSFLFDKNYEKVNNILSEDFSEKIKKPSDSVEVSKPSGDFQVGYLNGMENQHITRITKNSNSFYDFKKEYEHSKLYLELNNEFLYSVPIRLQKFQNKYAQGRSVNGELTYQSPETDEIFSWGPNVSLLEYSDATSEFYPQGNIVNQSFGNGNPIQLFNPNDFFKNTIETKSSVIAQIESPKGNYLKMNFGYKTGNIVIPTSRNNEITTSLKYFRNVSDYSKIEAILSYNDFENNLSNSNFGVNKIIFANAVTPVHFNNNLRTVLSDGSQRSFSSLENNSYYLINKNLDKNKSKTISFNLTHNYQENNSTNTANINFQSSDINNKNGQNPYFAGIIAPNFDERIEKFKTISAFDMFKHTFDYSRLILESKIDFRYQQRQLNRNYFTNFSSPSDFPNNGHLEDRIDISQDRFEVLYNINGSYVFRDALFYDNDVNLKLASDLNYSSTVKGKILSNFMASAEIPRLFNYRFSLNIGQSFNQVEPSLQNNNLNFNSLFYDVSQFKQIRNNMELITQKNAVPTNEAQTNIGIAYNFWRSFNMNLNYYHKKVENLYTPVFNANAFQWSPAVDYKQNGLEFQIEKLNYNYRNYHDNRFNYSFNLNFTWYKNKVTDINIDRERIPIAGFSDVSKNYIVGQPLGVIVGNGYLRDENHNVVIDAQGFPIEDMQPRILGNPNPDFVVGFANTFKYKDFSLNLAFDWSQGGEIWNGTQQTLNYYGTSELTGNQRNISGYVFNGVTQSGQQNSQPVDFYNTNLPVEQNRWTRYGVDGVAEDAIESATYFRLNSINLSYSNELDYSNEKFKFTISVFMNNVFIFSESKTAFSNNSLFNSIESSGLDYFNTPMMRSIGTSINIKF